MTLTRFQRDIIEKLLTCLQVGNNRLNQIDLISQEGLETNGKEILYRYKSSHTPDTPEKKYGENLVLDGLEIVSSELDSGASAAVFLKNGLISFLQILSHSGEFPENELTDYTLKSILLESCSTEI